MDYSIPIRVVKRNRKLNRGEFDPWRAFHIFASTDGNAPVILQNRNKILKLLVKPDVRGSF
ncbi:hypothetical protein SUGI_0547360 [Cryptomeria japonica]|nr:hypothetical protein SUGI_0547360 [Cryptomeria japonica]